MVALSAEASRGVSLKKKTAQDVRNNDRGDQAGNRQGSCVGSSRVECLLDNRTKSWLYQLRVREEEFSKDCLPELDNGTLLNSNFDLLPRTSKELEETSEDNIGVVEERGVPRLKPLRIGRGPKSPNGGLVNILGLGWEYYRSTLSAHTKHYLTGSRAFHLIYGDASKERFGRCVDAKRKGDFLSITAVKSIRRTIQALIGLGAVVFALRFGGLLSEPEYSG
ncbi:hypothetical protein Tco_0860150 [Tanacetum coccineum]|uniref:Uncharacterized protein n=1 Tax=Tanacetum coccineum TaxID=301880 RepID=A0ABQ5BH19_9ASTR